MSLDDVIAELRELNEEVPRPPRLPTAEEVDAAQRRLGVTFHPDYRKYLLAASDVVLGSLEPCTVAPPGGHTDLVEVATAAWEELGVPRDLLPICEDDGDSYCMNGQGQVVLWHDGASDERWPDLAAWIEQVWIGEG